MNTKKKTILAAAFVVAIIALAGVGYAAWSDNYTGSTESVASTYDVDWVKVSLDTTNGYTTATGSLYVVFNTSTEYANSQLTTTYFWKGSSEITHAVTVTIPADYNVNTQDKDTFKLAAAVADSSLPAYYKVQYNYNASGWEDYDGSDLAAGDIEVSTFGSAINILWRIVPNQNSTFTNGTPVEVTADNFAGTESSLTLGAVTYTVTATQYAVAHP